MFEIRKLEVKDLQAYMHWMQPEMKHHDYNGPYYGRRDKEALELHVEDLKKKLLSGQVALPNKRLVVDADDGSLIGQVNWYWKSEETYWMEIGIVIFNDQYWGQGIGEKVLSQWIDIIFEENPSLVRLGLTTWSGNHSMMALAEKLGFKKEAVYRKARIVNGCYYDSVSYGILIEEWQMLKEDKRSCNKEASNV